MTTIGDVTSLVTKGTTPTTLGKAFTSKGIGFIKAETITPDGFLDKGKQVFIDSETDEVLRRSKLQDADVLFTIAGVIGRTALVDKSFLPANTNQAIAILRPDRDKIIPEFLYYTVRSDDFLSHSLGRVVQTAQANVSLGVLSAAPIYLPSLFIQRRIAGILSAYDDLIENSQRRINILEEMARRLYREWFVHFRFPGHEGCKFVNSPLGEIPEGWEVKKLANVAEVNRAHINARTAPEELHYIDISSVSPGRIDSMTTYAFADAPGRARRIVQHGDVLWSCVRPNRRSYAQMMYPEANTIASTGFAVLTAKKVPFTFLYFATTTDDFVAFLTNNATGAAYPAVSAATFEKAELLIPSALLLDKFGDETSPITEQIHTLQRQIQNLRRTRDLLLPRLLSGQIDVEALQVPAFQEVS
jgi:type I restriction enzyme S subunit